MKILFVSMPSIHAIRWVENLKGTNYELYWFDILDKGKLNVDIKITKFIGWKKRKLPYVKGEYALSKKIPMLYEKIQPFLEVTKNEALGNIIEQIQPDIVHSFEMQSCSYPLLKVMQNNPSIKWVYSCWGSDLYYYQHIKKHKNQIKKVLKRVDYLQTDCKRDITLAKQLGFKGVDLEVIPGGSGFHLEEMNAYKRSLSSRKIILVKGYEHNFGRAINVLKALDKLKNQITDFQIVVFTAHQKTINFIEKNNLGFTYYKKDLLNHQQVLKLMGKSKIYIGNSISDGMPNTLLEAIVMNAFPIQSNPGNVTSEIIENSINGLLINNPLDTNEIEKCILKAINMNFEEIEKAAEINNKIANNKLDYKLLKNKIILMYNNVHNS